MTAFFDRFIRAPTMHNRAGRNTISPSSDATIWLAIRKPNRDVGVKLDKHRASMPIVLIAVDSSSGRPLCSRAA